MKSKQNETAKRQISTRYSVVCITTSLFLTVLMPPQPAFGQEKTPMEMKNSTDPTTANEHQPLPEQIEPQTTQEIPKISVSISTSENIPQAILPENQNSSGTFKGDNMPSGLEKYDWQADIIFFSDTFNDFPALAISRLSPKSGWILLYSNSELPDIRKKAAFLRSSGVAVKSITNSIIINDDSSGVNVISTATYTQDLIDKFATRTQFLEMFYYRQVYKNEFMRTGLLLGLPIAWQTYTVVCTLDNNSRFSESGHAIGLGLTPGLSASFGSVSASNNGLVGSMFLIYNKVWFKSLNGKLAEPLQDRLNDFRFGFSFGWRFR